MRNKRDSNDERQAMQDEIDNQSKRVGMTLSTIRRSRGLSGEAVASLARISRRTLTKIEAGDAGVAISSYLAAAQVIDAPWLFDVAAGAPYRSSTVPAYYLSGATALSIPWPDRPVPPLPYLLENTDPARWHVAGHNIVDGRKLLGMVGVCDLTDTVSTITGVQLALVWVANYERALFDLLHHSCEIRQQVMPNLQVGDVADVVDIQLIESWITSLKPMISDTGMKNMLEWLEVEQ